MLLNILNLLEETASRVVDFFWKGANVKDIGENVSTGKYRASNLTISNIFETSFDLLGWKD